MKIYSVGGAVRDQLMGLVPSDYDYVVVGGTPQAMLDAGFRTVGKDFPVFLHPETQEEYALARTERKSGNGYTGFTVHAAPDVTLEDDLARRDLTINAMAQSDEGVIVDPYGGQVDLANKVLRHVRAESFVEDPVRVLRLARFAARYTEFTVAPETMALCRRMVSAGELHHLVAERVWQELAKGLMESQPSRMLSILQACGALAVILPEVAKLAGTPQPRQWHPEIDSLVHVKMVLDCAAKQGASLEVRFACLVHDLGKALTPVENWPAHHDHEELGIPVVEAVAKRLRVPASCRELAVMVCREHTRIHQMQVLKATSIAHLLQRIDAYRRPARVEELIQACECDARGRLGFENRAYPQAMVLRSAHAAARAVAVGEIAKACKNPAHIPERIHGARSHAIKAVLAEIKSTGDNNLV